MYPQEVKHTSISITDMGDSLSALEFPGSLVH